ncbi:hypothetical protein L596_011468 [Steinernema carpocapsae]|uniref:Uncharacterized protein n=1 Tax=Steinernema carpocapsae TaxID=34508 RepID=A0A4U5NTY9_STECR|nr:hypothetical protein L596_011468 [Steinernema carpocapsae]
MMKTTMDAVLEVTFSNEYNEKYADVHSQLDSGLIYVPNMKAFPKISFGRTWISRHFCFCSIQFTRSIDRKFQDRNSRIDLDFRALWSCLKRNFSTWTKTS